MYSYHIFYFPFKWKIEKNANKVFAKQVSLSNIRPSYLSNWETNYSPQDQNELEELYNEKNYYFKFVHPVLYDDGALNSLVRHYERKEPKHEEVFYHIKVRKNDQLLDYKLRVGTINLNFYSTGVGMLSFYLENHEKNDFQSVLNINQYGRRIFPPFYKDIDCRREIALSISIEGLYGGVERYTENFERYTTSMDWQPAMFLSNLIGDLQEDLKILPVIDDRMFVNCWYGKNEIADEFSLNEEECKRMEKENQDPVIAKQIIEEKQEKRLSNFLNKDFWYEYVFVDSSSPTCQNRTMREGLLEKATYKRWQMNGSLYGVSRYSLVLLTNESGFAKDVLQVHMRTIYSRMIELVLVQRASMLRFSGEVTVLSRLSPHDTKVSAIKIASLYQEYIRFVNQIFFRSVTSQDQGIELYQLFVNQFELEKQIGDLEDEIGELHQYISLLIEKAKSEQGALLNQIAAILLPATILTGFFGMNPICSNNSWLSQGIIIVVVTLVVFFLLLNIKKMK